MTSPFTRTDEIKDYFGERIGLYFLFLQYYSSSMMLPALLGFIVFSVRIYYNKTGYFLMPVFAAYITVWCSYFVEIWKGIQATTAMEWGVTGTAFLMLILYIIARVTHRRRMPPLALQVSRTRSRTASSSWAWTPLAPWTGRP